MSKIAVSIKIDVTKIDKSRLFKGEKGTYLDLTTFIDLDQKDQYDNNGFISQSVSKEEKENNVQTPILGNCRVFWKEQNSTPQSSAQPQAQALPDDDDDIPF
jgi:single-stranded DNA-binding protein